MTTQIDLEALKAAAMAASTKMVRSHGWAGTVEMLDAMRLDEAFILAASPETVLALIAEVDQARQSAARQEQAVAWALVSPKGGIKKLSITRESVERKMSVWLEEWPGNTPIIRPLVYGDTPAQTSSGACAGCSPTTDHQGEKL